MNEEWNEEELQEQVSQEEQSQAQSEQSQLPVPSEERVQAYVKLLQAVPQLQSQQRLPDAVMQRIVRGEAPLSAYRAYENEQLKAQIAALQRRANAPGSVKSTVMPALKDSFSAGFDEGFLY